MIEILMDMHIADAHINLAVTPQDSAKQILTHEYKEIFADHHISQDQFNESYNWYTNHSDQLDAMDEEIVARLEKQKESLE